MTKSAKKLGTIQPGQIYHRKKKPENIHGKKCELEYFFYIKDVYLREPRHIFGSEPEVCFAIYELTATDGHFNLPEDNHVLKISEVEASSILTYLKGSTLYKTNPKISTYDDFTDCVMESGKRILILGALTNATCALGLIVANLIMEFLN